MFTGKLVATKNFSHLLQARLFEVEDILSGTIDSTGSETLELQKTDSQVWVFINTQYIDQITTRSLIIAKYSSSLGGYYIDYNCVSYFPISAEGEIEGYIFDTDFEETLEVELIQESLIEECAIDSNELIEFLEKEIVISPNPIHNLNYFNILLPKAFEENDFTIEIYSGMGQLVSTRPKTIEQIFGEGNYEKTRLCYDSISASPGMYFVIFRFNKYVISKKLFLV